MAKARTSKPVAKKGSTTRAKTKSVARAGAVATTAAGKRAEELLELIARRKARIAEDFFEIGQALREILKKKLYVALGYESFAELLTKRGVMSPRTADKLIEIAEAVPRTRAMELGQEKAYALARLVAATPELDSVESVLEKGVKVGGARKSVARASTRQVIETTRAVRASTTKPDPEQVAATKAARALQAAARAAGAKGATAVAARAAGGVGVELRLTLAAAEALVRALR